MFAAYNGKDKAIGVATFDLATFINKGASGQGLKNKVYFQKCFDKNAAVTFSVKWTEQCQPIQEMSMIEETAEDAGDISIARISTLPDDEDMTHMSYRSVDFEVAAANKPEAIPILNLPIISRSRTSMK